ncbi:MAG: 4-(cytidine 5'-diphospho)-2-C-methyl-D-erythritol kinase, partial [Bacteroidales bacterium]|nr:4-(cytidine 5'-diphospho)-2-C-methyl-D-erythritol kinase [Bacteroidales bacterium]
MENSISANAKINIGLNIVRRREDGYHDIETIFYPVNIADRIVIRHGTDTNLACYAGDDGKQMEIAGQNTIDTAFALLKARY